MSSYRETFSAMYTNMAVNNVDGVNSAVNLILPNAARYKNVADEFKMPWGVVGALHYRESSCQFDCHLANGNPLSADTVDVPRALMAPLNPPYTWEEAAIAALKNQFTGWNIDPNNFTWDIGGTLYFIQCWHGFGIVQRGDNDAYLWNFTKYYVSGGYIADGTYSGYVVDENAGCAPLLKALGFNEVSAPTQLPPGR